ncbi:MAG: bifunctional diaminohydroxyphosphoribosylaminopyrimidine deaminase/5-amino-6-(5-phosphoribosylamino)uracil reductase RibD [Deltaproteobacteria bacterium]|nr:bifunctional diaminohydroxyphosphoribosylaminopyrimidine deaminase/5-amino-6-(5-phosphoribosylamino)uracil reductase RibD [Deltaproteobacteria bacterium]
MDDLYFMKTALDLAVRGRGFTSPNPMVGAVVVKAGQIVGRGWHKQAGGPHAEVHAIDDAGSLAKDATLYVTLEPCNHTGRTPPCTEKILQSGISRVVVAMKDPNPDVKGKGMDYLKAKGVKITSGVCRDEAKKLNEIFIKYIQTKRPFVILKCAATLDGRIATKTGDSKWVTGPESREFVHKVRHAVDSIMVGIGTVEKDDPSLTTRLKDVKNLDPTRIILDTHLSISENAKMLQLDSDSNTLIFCNDSPSINKKTALEKKGAKVIQAPLKKDLINLDYVMDYLGSLGITSLLIEGGSRVIASTLAAGIVDKVFFFFSPKILGGDDGVPICKGPGPALMKNAIPVKDISVRRFDEDVMIEGYIDNQVN